MSLRRRQRAEPSGAEQRAGQVQERGQEVGAALVADRQAPVGQQPGQRPLHLPALSAQPRVGLHPTPGDPRADPAPPQQLPAGWVVVALIAMELGRPLAWPTADLAGR
jgi:hypothetical protein